MLLIVGLLIVLGFIVKFMTLITGITCTIIGVLGFVFSLLSCFNSSANLIVSILYLMLSVAVTSFGVFCLYRFKDNKKHDTTKE